MIAVVVSVVMSRVDENIQKIESVFKLEQKYAQKSIWLGSFSGVYLHVLLDSPLYPDIRPLFPLPVNPFYSSSMFVGFEIYSLCVISFILGIALYVYKVLMKR